MTFEEAEVLEQEEIRKENRRINLRRGIPFGLVCLSCGEAYEGCFNDFPCPKCGETENIRWMLRDGFEKLIQNPKEVSIQNMKIKIAGGLKI
jgi:Fe2+ or Zn2+ uptake regulation protein